VKRIVSICPHCVRTIAQDWLEFGEPPAIEHHSEFMARNLDKLTADKLPAGAAREKVAYHDPCYLGRYRSVYDQPRRVVARFAEPVEAERARERSFCCGAGGGLAFLGEEKGRRVSVERAEQLADTGAGVVGAACPFCNTMLRDALSGMGEGAPKLLDIAQIVAAGLPPARRSSA
jgi:Fe-S oxidoreductase